MNNKLDYRCMQSPYLVFRSVENSTNPVGYYTSDKSAASLRRGWNQMPRDWKILNRDLCGGCDNCRECRSPYEVETWVDSNLGPIGTTYLAAGRKPLAR